MWCVVFVYDCVYLFRLAGHIISISFRPSYPPTLPPTSLSPSPSLPPSLLPSYPPTSLPPSPSLPPSLPPSLLSSYSPSYLQADVQQANLDGYYVGITVVFGYSFLLASFVLVLVAENESKVVVFFLNLVGCSTRRA